MGIYRTSNPMEYAQVDGIVIDEKAPTPTIRAVGTGTAIMVGQFDEGPTDILTEINSREALIETFGQGSSGYLALINKRFSRLRVIRVSETPSSKAMRTFGSEP